MFPSRKRLPSLPRSVRRPRRFVLLLLLVGVLIWLLSGSCEDDSGLPSFSASDQETQARDYMPFASEGSIIRWEADKNITVLLPQDGARENLKEIGDDAPVEGWSPCLNEAFVAGITAPQSAWSECLIASYYPDGPPSELNAPGPWTNVFEQVGLSIEYVSSGANDIRVTWTDEICELIGEDDRCNVLGFASFTSNQFDPSRRVVLSTLVEHIGRGIGQADVPKIILAVTAHEFGHILGIWSHSTDTDDLMYPSLQLDVVSSLSERDQASLIRAYSLPADIDLAAWRENSGLVAEQFEKQAEPQGVRTSDRWEIRFTLYLDAEGQVRGRQRVLFF